MRKSDRFEVALWAVLALAMGFWVMFLAVEELAR